MKKTLIDVSIMSVVFFLILYICSFFVPSNDIKVSSENKIMYLTFDDGPSKNTEAILDILDQYQVKATFFVSGNSEKHFPLLKEIKKRGHAIGVHTYSHDYSKIYQSKESYFDDLQKMNAVIKQYTGTTTKLLRFPGGSSNTISRKYHPKIMSILADEVSKQGYQYYDWNASNGDGEGSNEREHLINIGKKEVAHLNNVMMLMHDGPSNHKTVEVLPQLLQYYQDLGFEFYTIDENTNGFHHTIVN